MVNFLDETKRCAEEFGFPLSIKPNVGRRGAGIVRVNSMAELESAIARQEIDLGVDHTALMQEFIPARGGHITRARD
ncbi:MAG: hypothetical protein ACR2II_03190 [Chthoniobacterales bacterium]